MNSTFSTVPSSVNAVTTAPQVAQIEYYLEPNPSKIFRYVVYGLIFLFAVGGNIAVCVVPIRHKRMRTFTYFLITNLALSDIGTMLCLPPLMMFDYTRTWTSGEAMCKLVNPSLTMFSLITTNTLVAIAIDRFMSLVFPFVRRPQKKETILVVTLTWLVAFACVLPSFGARKLMSVVDQGQLYYYCEEIFPGETMEARVYHKKIYDIALYLINCTIPIIIISVVYVIIIFRLKGISVTKAFKRKSSKSSFDGYSQPGALTSDEVYLKQKNERERKFMHMLLSVVVVFVLFYVPVQTLFMLNTLLPSTNQWYYLHITYQYLYLMMWVPNALNPILYGAMNEQYAKAFKKILCCKGRRKDGFGSTLGSYSKAPMTTMNTRNDIAGSNTRDTEMTLM